MDNEFKIPPGVEKLSHGIYKMCLTAAEEGLSPTNTIKAVGAAATLLSVHASNPDRVIRDLQDCLDLLKTSEDFKKIMKGVRS